MKKKVFRERYANRELTTNDILENTSKYIEAILDEKIEEIKEEKPKKRGRKKSDKSSK